MNSAARGERESRRKIAPLLISPFLEQCRGISRDPSAESTRRFSRQRHGTAKGGWRKRSRDQGRKKEHENQFSPRLPLRSFMRNCTGLRNRKKHKSSPGNPVDSFLLQINDSLLPSISRFVQRVRLFSPSFRYRRILLCIYIYIYT